MRVMRRVLDDLQDEAKEIFAGSGETVARFLRERQEEALREGDLPA
jgi:hypothetical protein